MTFEPLGRDLNVIGYVRNRCNRVLTITPRRKIAPEIREKNRRDAEDWLELHRRWEESRTEENFRNLKNAIKLLDFLQTDYKGTGPPSPWRSH